MSSRGRKKLTARPAFQIWCAIVAIACVALLAYGATGARSTGDGSLLAQLWRNLPYALAIALVLHVVFRHRLPQWFGWLGLGAVYLSLLAASALSISRQQAERRAAEQAAQHAAALAAAASAASAAADTVSAADTLKMGELIRALHARAVAQRQDYQRELDALGWARVLDGNRLRQDGSFEQTRVLVERARTLAASYHGHTPQLFADMRRDLAAAPLGEAAKRRLRAELDETLERNQAQALESWTLETQVLGEVEAAARFLHDNPSAWQSAQGQITFRRPGDRDRFNAQMDKVRALTDHQERLRTAAARRTQQALSRFAG